MSDRQIARKAANRIVDEHRGAWGGVLLQVDWMTDVIEQALDELDHKIMHEEGYKQRPCPRCEKFGA